MSVKIYLKDKTPFIIFQIFGLLVLTLYLFSVGNSIQTLMTVNIGWILSHVLFGLIEYRHRKLYFSKLETTVSRLDKKYLISEVIEEPPYMEAAPFYYLIKKGGKSMLEEINKEKNSSREYKEYIEQWVHEIKTPIAAVKLLEENHKTSISRKVLLELENIERYVEQALFYARSKEVEKDYFIKSMKLEECVTQVLLRNKQFFIMGGIEIQLEGLDTEVYCDIKWVEFILNQLLINSIKYRNHEKSWIKIYTEIKSHGVQLIVEDNGIGIAADELNRVFTKGFTGKNGRVRHKSTGMGLYLCKKLCEKLGLLIQIESIENVGTKGILTFPVGGTHLLSDKTVT